MCTHLPEPPYKLELLRRSQEIFGKWHPHGDVIDLYGRKYKMHKKCIHHQLTVTHTLNRNCLGFGKSGGKKWTVVRAQQKSQTEDLAPRSNAEVGISGWLCVKKKCLYHHLIVLLIASLHQATKSTNLYTEQFKSRWYCHVVCG